MDQMDFRGSVRIFLFLFYICGVILGTQSLKAPQLNPERVVVKYGDSVSVNCSTEEKDVGIGFEAPHDAVDLTKETMMITWNPKKVTEWGIKVSCYTTHNTNGDQSETKLNIVVYKTPDRVSVSIVNHTKPLIEGQQYELRCDVQDVAPVNLLTVNWYRGDTLLKNRTFKDINDSKPLNVNDTLMITANRSDDGVEYRCETVQKLGPEGPQPPPTVTSETLSFTVYYPPEKILELKNAHVDLGESVVLNCVSSAKPSPSYTWKYFYMSNVKIMSNHNGSTLSITNASGLNNGNYTCIVKNDAGEKRHTVRVNVRKTPDRVSVSNHNPTGSLTEGQQYELRCDVQNVAPVNLLTVSWYRGDTLLKNRTFKDRTDLKPVDVSDTLMITANRSDEGKYRCETVQELGPEGPQTPLTVTSEPFSLNVQYPPNKILELKDTQVDRGKSMDLNCVSSAKPSPNYRWEYFRMLNVYSTTNNNGSTLSITNARELNTGDYTCIVSNSLGEKRHTVRVNVRGAENDCPLTLNSSHIFLKYGDNTTVTCSTPETHLVESVYWKYSNTIVRGPNFELNSVDFAKSNKQLSCHGNFTADVQCVKYLNVTVYKYPDKVSITSETAGPMNTGTSYTLRCNVLNVLPVQSSTVKWYRGGEVVNTSYFKSTFTAPKHETFNLTITPGKEDNGLQYRCEVDMNLGSEGPQPPSNLTLDPLKINVHYKPVINRTKLPDRVPLFIGYPEVLTCEADGNPTPSISWSYSDGNMSRVNLTILDKGGKYTCIAQNSAGRDSQDVMVDIGNDYLPLIAGIVAIVVTVTIVVFTIIYCIYYKNTKMGHYTLKGAKPNAQNGDVAQNGKDGTIPMKKIPMSSA